MTNVTSLEGLMAVVLVFICSCVHIRRVRALKFITLSWNHYGPLSIFHKASVIGIRLSVSVASLCFALALYVVLR
jgi:hypothetical protein